MRLLPIAYAVIRREGVFCMSMRKHRPLSSASKRKAPKQVDESSAQISYFDEFEAPAMRIEDAIDRFMAIKKSANLRGPTITIYRKSLKYFYEWLQEAHEEVIYVNQVTRKIIEEFISYSLEDRKLAANSINGRVRVLKTMYNTLIDDGEELVNPATKVSLLKTDSTKIRVYTEDQIHRLLDECDIRSYVGFRDATFILLALDTGMRVSETLALKMSDIDFVSRTISIGGDISKSRKSRVVPFSAYTSKQLRELVEENRYHFEGEVNIFLSITGGKMSAAGLRKRLHDLGDRSGVSKEIEVAPHSFRHTAATTMLRNGMDLYSLSRILGHSTLDMTRKYLALSPKDLSVRHDKYSPVQQFRTRKRRF